jgi:hypothetical protein
MEFERGSRTDNANGLIVVVFLVRAGGSHAGMHDKGKLVCCCNRDCGPLARHHRRHHHWLVVEVEPRLARYKQKLGVMWMRGMQKSVTVRFRFCS